MRSFIRILTLSSLVVAPVASPAQTAVDPSGHWEGTIQGLEIPVSAITQSGPNVTLVVKSINGSCTGAVNGAGTELAGTFSQGTGSVPLTFRRAR